jgi:hypothetical protein
MNFDFAQDMIDGMDDTAGLLPAHLPASQQSAFFWQGQPSVVAAQLRPQRIDRSTAARHYSHPVEGQAAGEKSFHRRQAIRLGGI